MPARGRMPTVHADAARDASGQFEQLHVEATAPRMVVAIAGCNERTREVN